MSSLIFSTALTGQCRHLRVEHGQTAILPCEFVIKSQYRCENTDWFFIGPEGRATVGLVRAGRVVVNTTDRSYRLGVREPCSLVIPMVTFHDIGHYFCRQLRSGFGRVQDSVVDLDVFIREYLPHNFFIDFACIDFKLTLPLLCSRQSTSWSRYHTFGRRRWEFLKSCSTVLSFNVKSNLQMSVLCCEFEVFISCHNMFFFLLNSLLTFAHVSRWGHNTSCNKNNHHSSIRNHWCSNGTTR